MNKILKLINIFLILAFSLILFNCNFGTLPEDNGYTKKNIGVGFQFHSRDTIINGKMEFSLVGNIWNCGSGANVNNSNLSDAQAWINNDIVTKTYYPDKSFQFIQRYTFSTGDTLTFKIYQGIIDTIRDTIVIPASVSTISVDSQDIELFLNDQYDSLYLFWNSGDCDRYHCSIKFSDENDNSLFWVRNELVINSFTLTEDQLLIYPKDTIAYMDIFITPENGISTNDGELFHYFYLVYSEETMNVSNR